ncbi:hypothetical protein CPC735_042520 [Coccidioides posadasii C735 delta SOWgp]|uniref:Uncharacterized protein n=1 Tax=Coccidioides posadasii (strain C735) TaxID=222929 RepID=C5PB24_COCP7|nr:hypothetical protein CPC735_042520 [Coccidioides posadasii C735 delta SOWgp]EER25808.1 hypothetical protein CPC735_042520 [Coccidioides posadasii C735 delta SOWgp]|eukprot:XP_003067953.1 hypothetical protein CPC735_042520 [Coccidioides posadasii C735 delta SOWgp]
MDQESDETDSVYDTASSTNSRPDLSNDAHYQRRRYHSNEVHNASDTPERSMSFRSMSRTPSSKYRNSDLVCQKIPPGEYAATIDEVLALNDAEPVQKVNSAEERRKDDDHNSISSQVCVSPSWSRAAQKRREKKEQRKKMEKEQKELERRLKQEAKRRKGSDSREPRRLQKRAPLAASSRASSAHSAFPLPSAASSRGSFWSRRTSGANSINDQYQGEVKKESRRFSFGGDNASGKKLKFPNVWPRRSTKPKERQGADQPSATENTPPDTNRHFLHTVKRHGDLRASAKAFEVIRGARTSFGPVSAHPKMRQSMPDGRRVGNMNGRADEGDIATQHRVFANRELRMPFEPVHNIRSQRQPSEAATLSQSLGSRAITGTDSLGIQIKARGPADKDARSKILSDERHPTPVVGLKNSEDGAETIGMSPVEHGSPKDTPTMKDPSSPHSPVQSTTCEMTNTREEEHSSSPGAKQSQPLSRNAYTPSSQNESQHGAASVTPNGSETQPIEPTPPQANFSRLEHPRIASNHIRDANFRSSPLAGPPLVVQHPEKGNETSAAEEQGHCTIETAQNPARRRNSLQAYIDSKRLTIPRFLGHGRRSNSGASMDLVQGRKKMGQAGSAVASSKSESTTVASSPLSSSTSPPDSPNSQKNGFSTAKSTDITDSSRPNRNSNDIMQRLRMGGDQREKLRKRAVSVDINSRSGSKTPETETLRHTVHDKPSGDRNSQPKTQTPQSLDSPRLSANTGKKISANPSKEPSSATPGPSQFRRSTSDYIPTSPSSLSLHRALGASPQGTGSSRTPGQQIAKMFVICCQCKHWHDMTSQAYAKLAFPDKTQDPAQGAADTVTSPTGLESPLRVFGGSPLASPNSSRTSLGVKEGKAPAKPTRPGHSSTSTLLNHSTICCWCYHQMAKACCAGWTTIVTMRERHH